MHLPEKYRINSTQPLFPFSPCLIKPQNSAPAKHWAGDGVRPSSHGASLYGSFLAQGNPNINSSSLPLNESDSHLEAPKQFKQCEIEEPNDPGPGEALIRTDQMGICGTDVSCYLGKFSLFRLSPCSGS